MMRVTQNAREMKFGRIRIDKIMLRTEGRINVMETSDNDDDYDDDDDDDDDNDDG